MRILTPILLTFTLLFSSCSTLKNYVVEPSALETITALQEVLNGSTFKAIQKLSKLSNEGLEGLLPEQFQPVIGTLNKIGLGDKIGDVSKIISDASLIAVKESEGVIKDAVKEIDFGDAASVILGGSDAASLVAKNALYGSVKKRYSQRLDQELSKTEVKQYWPMASNAYNLFAKKKVGTDLSDFLAERAVDAMFIAIGKEEAVIRKNPSSLGKQVVTKVFDYYQNKK